MAWLKYLRNHLNIWEMTKNMLEMAKICEKWLKYLRSGLNM